MAELKITKDNFEAEVLHAKHPVLLDFWAPWCGPCRMLAPVIEELAKEYAGRAVVGKVNVDEQPELAAAFRVASIPTVAVLKDGKVVNVSVGYKPKEALAALLA
ncbi:MAG TPA: thioredoxin [Firmicutes bacterium]|jgi:thioredoxin|nr:thioredoxin [Bacillota bacterium]